jgi:MSHA biogenesis protein MshP
MVSAIVILVVLAGLGAALVTVSTLDHMGSAADVQGARAYQAARAGVEWGMYNVQSTPAYNFSYGPGPGAIGSADPNLRACPASPTSFALPNAPSLSAFTVTVTCTAFVDANGGPTVFEIISTACNAPAAGACPGGVGGPIYIERQVRATI